jgi:hypothetical protein
VVHVIGYRERDLRHTVLAARCSLAGGDVAGAADHLAVRQREQRYLIRRGVPADPPRLGIGCQPAEVEKAHVAVVRGQRLVHGLDRAEIVRAGRADLDRRSVGQKRVHLAGPVYYLRRAHGGLPCFLASLSG